MRLPRVTALLFVFLAGACNGDDPPPGPADVSVVADRAADGSGDAADRGAEAGKDGSTDSGPDSGLCNGVSCDDKLACTTDLCNAGVCQNTVIAGQCLINKTCYKDGDKNPTAQCGKCASSSSSSAWTDDAALCSGAGLSCTTASCSAGSCSQTIKSGYCLVSSICLKDGAANPKNACRVCDTSKSPNSYQNAADGSSCASDNLSCTSDTCKAGQCAHQLQSGSCLINGVCYLKGELNPLVACQACDPVQSTSSWSTQTDGASCSDDGLSCTTDSCSSGQCTHKVKAGSCVINGSCVAGGSKNPQSECATCDPTRSTTAWSARADGSACTADALGCTDDGCKAGQCAHQLKSGNCLINGTCQVAGTKQPGKDCKSCNPAKSTTTWTVAAAGTACTPDNYSCTVDACKGGSCTHEVKAGSCLISGTCHTSGTVHPTQACTSCNPSISTTSWSAQVDGSSCKADANSCTRDICASGKCTHPLKPGYCLIGNSCHGKGTQNPANSCQYCDPSQSVTAWSALGNGIACQADSLSCTNDVCSAGICSHPLKSGYCMIGNSCHSAGSSMNGNSCLTCIPGKSTSSWSVAPNGTSCSSDGKSCTSDVCSGGVCVHNLQQGSCLIGGACHGSGTDHPYLSCQTCNPGITAYGWSPKPNGMPCASDGKFCTNDACSSGSCAHTPLSNYCHIGGSCYTSGQHASSTSCLYCNPVKSTTGWSSYTYQGCCWGNVLRYCDSNGVYKVLDCTPELLVCGWWATNSFYACTLSGGADPSGTYPKGC